MNRPIYSGEMNGLTARRHILLNDNDGSSDIFFLHSLAVNLHLFDCDFWVFREKDKHLVGRIVGVARNNSQIFSA